MHCSVLRIILSPYSFANQESAHLWIGLEWKQDHQPWQGVRVTVTLMGFFLQSKTYIWTMHLGLHMMIWSYQIIPAWVLMPSFLRFIAHVHQLSLQVLHSLATLALVRNPHLSPSSYITHIWSHAAIGPFRMDDVTSNTSNQVYNTKRSLNPFISLRYQNDQRVT